MPTDELNFVLNLSNVSCYPLFGLLKHRLQGIPKFKTEFSTLHGSM